MDDVKAIFLDMDGTLLHENNQVSLYTKEIIDQLRTNGYKVFLATGRSHDEIHFLVPEHFEVDGIISSNGTWAYTGWCFVQTHVVTDPSIGHCSTGKSRQYLL